MEARVRGPREIWGKGPQPRVRGLTTFYDQMPSSALAAEILTPGEGQIRALIVSGGNPAVALPNQSEVIEALAVVGVARLSRCARIADRGTCRLCVGVQDQSRKGRCHCRKRPSIRETVRPVHTSDRAAQGDLVEEWEVFWGLAARMGTPWDLTARIGLPIPLNLREEAADTPSTAKPTSWDLWNLLCSGGRVTLEELSQHPHGLSLRNRAAVRTRNQVIPGTSWIWRTRS